MEWEILLQSSLESMVYPSKLGLFLSYAQKYLLKEEMNGTHDRWDPCLFSAHSLTTISTNKRAVTWHCDMYSQQGNGRELEEHIEGQPGGGRAVRIK